MTVVNIKLGRNDTTLFIKELDKGALFIIKLDKITPGYGCKYYVITALTFGFSKFSTNEIVQNLLLSM